MAAFVASNASQATVNVSVALTGTTAGNGLAIFLCTVTGTIASPAMTGETLVDLGTKSTDGTLALDLHGWCVNQLQSGGTKTFTATCAGDHVAIILEFSGQNTGGFYVTGSGAFAGDQSGGTQTVNVVTTGANQAVIGFGDLHNAVPTAGTGYTFPTPNGTGFASENVRAQYDTDLSSSVGTVAFSMGNTGSEFWAIKGYAFQFTAASTTPITVNNLPIDSLAGGEIV